jgi:phage tail-like protein
MDTTTIAKLLPEVFREAHHPGGVLDALFAVMELCITPSENALSSLDAWFDPRRAPDDFLWMLARWTALGPYVDDAEFDGEGRRSRTSIDLGNLRELVARSATLARIRGTREGLLTTLEIVTGIRGFEVEENPPGENGRPQPYFFRVRAPASAKALEDLVALVVDREKPAFATAKIEYSDQ